MFPHEIPTFLFDPSAFKEIDPSPVQCPRPELQLAMQWTVPDTAQSIQFAMKGNINGLRNLFRRGFASPRDVSSSRRFSLIRWALYGGLHQYETVQFLLSEGAFVDEESYEHVWDFGFRMKCSPIEQEALGSIRNALLERDWIEEQKFHQIHLIIFRLCSKPLIAELDENPDAVYLKDSQGRTALDWATAQAQLEDMKLLIKRGSNLNTMDIRGRTTVLHAVDSHNDEVLRIVLEAGADPNPSMPKGLFRSKPLTSASFGGLKHMVELLLKFGANIDGCNPEGRTALHTVASKQHFECAVILLQHGADLNHMSINERTPIATSIAHNSYSVLRLFLGQIHKHTRLEGPELLPIIAENADAETMLILTSSYSLLQLLAKEEHNVAACRETLWGREDYEITLGHALENLLSTIIRLPLASLESTSSFEQLANLSGCKAR